MSDGQSDDDKLFEEMRPILLKYNNDTVYTTCALLMGYIVKQESPNQKKIEIIDTTRALLVELACAGGGT